MNVKGHPWLGRGGIKTLMCGKEGRWPLLTGGSWRATNMGGDVSRLKLFIRERNTSQLPRLLCCTMEKERRIPLACRGDKGELLYCIIGPGPGHLSGPGKGWGPSRGADHLPQE